MYVSDIHKSDFCSMKLTFQLLTPVWQLTNLKYQPVNSQQLSILNSKPLFSKRNQGPQYPDPGSRS